MENQDVDIWDSYSYFSSNQKKSILELTDSYDHPIILNDHVASNDQARNNSYLDAQYEHYSTDYKLNKLFEVFDSRAEKNINEKIDKISSRLALFKEFLFFTDSLLDITNKINSRFIEFKQNIEDIKSLNIETLNEMEILNLDLNTLNVFIQELEDIQKLTNIKKININNLEIVGLLLNSVDHSDKFLSKIKNKFPEIDNYYQNISNIRSKILSALVNTLSNILSKNASQVIQTASLENETHYSEFINIFESNSLEFQNFITVISSRVENNIQYSKLIDNVFQKYSEMRNKLVISLLSNTLTNLSLSNSTDILNLTKLACNFLQNICESEYKLAVKYFGSPPPSTTISYITSIANFTNENLLPIIFKAKELDTICGLLSLISNDLSVLPKQDTGWEKVYINSIYQLRREVTSRLLYKIDEYFSNKVFKCEINRENLILSLNDKTNSENDSVSVNLTNNSSFEPINNLCKLLSDIYPLIQKSLFEKIARDSISSCIPILEATFTTINQTHKIEAHLFMIKHLLNLRERLSTFDVSFITREIVLEFGDFKKAAFNLLKNPSNLLSLSSSNSLLKFFIDGAPRLCEKWIDSKKEIEIKIREYCFKLIRIVSSYLSSDLANLETCIEGIGTEEVGQSATTSPEHIKSEINQYYSSLKAKSSEIKHYFSLYLENDQTESILFKPIKLNILSEYSKLFTLVEKSYPEEAKMIIGMPLPEQISIILA